MLPALRQAFLRLKMIALEDALAANGPHIQTLKSHEFSFIIRAKPAGNTSLMKSVQARMKAGETDEFESVDAQGIRRGYRFINEVPLNENHPNIRVNYLDYWALDSDGHKKNLVVLH